MKKYTKATEQGETLLSRIALDHTLDGTCADDLEDDIINIRSDQKTNLVHGQMMDEDLLKPMDANGGITYKILSQKLEVWCLFSQAKIVTKNGMFCTSLHTS